MNSRQQRVYESLRDTVQLLDASKFDRPTIAPLRGKLRTATKQVRDLFQEQVNFDYVGRGRSVAEHRKEVRTLMMRISRHAVAVLEGLPGIKDDVRVPHANVKRADLIEAVDRMVKNVRPHRKTLFKTGLPKEVFAQLDRARRALEKKVTDPDTAMARRSSATSALPTAIVRARNIVGALDSVIKAEFADDSQTLLLWNGAKRIPGKMGRPKKRRRPLAPSP